MFAGFFLIKMIKFELRSHTWRPLMVSELHAWGGADQVNRVWFWDLSPMSQRGVFYPRRLFTWEEMEIKYKVSERNRGANEAGEGGGEVSCSRSLVLFSRCPPHPPTGSPLVSPCRGDLDWEECAPCSVSGESGGGRKGNF